MIPGHERYGGPMTGSIQMVEGSKSVLNNGYKEVDATSPAVIPEGDQIHVKFDCIVIYGFAGWTSSLFELCLDL